MVELEKETQAELEEELEEEEEEEEEYVLLDFDSITEHISIPENAPYVLSGLDTLNPIIVIDNKIKLIGEYKETIGTCLVFNESDADSTLREQEAGPSEANKNPSKQIKPMTQLTKVLKFRLYLEPDSEDGANKQANDVM